MVVSSAGRWRQHLCILIHSNIGVKRKINRGLYRAPPDKTILVTEHSFAQHRNVKIS